MGPGALFKLVPGPLVSDCIMLEERLFVGQLLSYLYLLWVPLIQTPMYALTS